MLEIPGILGEICRKKLETLKRTPAPAPYEGRHEPRSLAKAFQDHRPKGTALFCEYKKKSPSKGVLSTEIEPETCAGEYLKEGALGISVLTERDYFGGDYEDLKRIRRAFPQALLLMKDFVVEKTQIDHARAIGADAVLLIVAVLGESLPLFMEHAALLGVSTLVEVHDEKELELALQAKAPLIGINNRNLKDLTIDLSVTERLAKRIPEGVPFISESGIDHGRDIIRLVKSGVYGFLIGTQLMKNGTPGVSLAKLKEQLSELG